MADAKPKNLPNLRVLRSFRLNGEHVEVGSIIAKSMFTMPDGTEDKGTWSELCSQMPQTCTQTDDPERYEPSPRERMVLDAGNDRNAPAAKNRGAAMPQI